MSRHRHCPVGKFRLAARRSAACSSHDVVEHVNHAGAGGELLVRQPVCGEDVSCMFLFGDRLGEHHVPSCCPGVVDSIHKVAVLAVTCRVTYSQAASW